MTPGTPFLLIPKGLRAYFSGSISHAHVRDLIFNNVADDQSALSAFAKQHRHSSPLVFPRQIHPTQVVSHVGLATGSQPTPSASTFPIPPLLPILYQQIGPVLRNSQCLSLLRPLRTLLAQAAVSAQGC